MRHGDKINNLGRTKAHREALLANLASQLITKKRIVTTLAKAKALRKYVEPLITKTKKNDSVNAISHNHRLVFSYLKDKLAVKELFTVVGPKIATRPGGYTRIIKLGIRVGDNAETAMIELVDFNEIYGNSIATSSDDSAKKTRRSRRSTKSTKDETTAAADANEISDATVVEESAPVEEKKAEETKEEGAE
ncbi:50S ribosomal protein L17 [Rhizosphaericola mali]|uniref:Large ribosomal subunit protein bL17 n=1 Tax=Rhizosphaericola mali TaxID=2545455 RepID=A0A5P2G3N8_9BACT|nr:50S ribosomal protein L17 [Rhizosphaericola mali]